MTDKLIILDTTLRDGEQSPGASMTRDEKLRIARQLERLRVDVIEAGFAAAELDGSWQPYRAQGCQACNRGYKGRVGVHQVMPVSDEIQRIILRDGSATEIAAQAQLEGVNTLRQSGLRKVKLGLTSLQEILSCTNA